MENQAVANSPRLFRGPAAYVPRTPWSTVAGSGRRRWSSSERASLAAVLVLGTGTVAATAGTGCRADRAGHERADLRWPFGRPSLSF